MNTKMTKSQRRVFDTVVALTKDDPKCIVSQKQMAEHMGIVGQLHKTSPRCTELVRDGWLVIKGTVGGDYGYAVNHDRVQSTLSTLEKAMMRLDEKRQVAYYGGQD